MALDTRDRRSSAIYVASPWRGKLPLPDSALSASDRQHVALHYSGIAADAPGDAPTLFQLALTGVGR